MKYLFTFESNFIFTHLQPVSLMWRLFKYFDERLTDATDGIVTLCTSMFDVYWATARSY